MNSCNRLLTCILCGSYDLSEQFNLCDSPLAENYNHIKMKQEKYPLQINMCHNCGNVQLGHYLNEDMLFSGYSYTTESSPGLVEHFRQYAMKHSSELKLSRDSVIVDIGGNDGTLLCQFAFESKSQKIINVEASCNLAEISRAKGILTLNEFWERDTSERIEKLFGKVDLITANNVFAHSQYFVGQIKNVRDLLKPEGTFIMEVSYLPDLIANRVVDFIYHEHLIYHSFKSLQKCMQQNGLRIIDFVRTPMKGGSIRFIISHAGSERRTSDSITELVLLENGLGDYYLLKFIEEVNYVAEKCSQELRKLYDSGAKILGYGASATTTTLLHHFQIGEYLCGLVDDNPNKNGMYSPGYNLPVLHPDMTPLIAPDFIFITAWRFAEQIIKKYPQYIGKFIVPLPEYKVL